MSRFNPDSNVVAHHGMIQKVAVDFNKYDLVFNALDNITARRHVNRVCLSVDVPLIESGTTGYLGQVYVIKKGETECYDCQPKPTPKVRGEERMRRGGKGKRSEGRKEDEWDHHCTSSV